jgi:hypothetical protein
MGDTFIGQVDACREFLVDLVALAGDVPLSEAIAFLEQANQSPVIARLLETAVTQRIQLVGRPAKPASVPSPPPRPVVGDTQRRVFGR